MLVQLHFSIVLLISRQNGSIFLSPVLQILLSDYPGKLQYVIFTIYSETQHWYIFVQ